MCPINFHVIGTSNIYLYSFLFFLNLFSSTSSESTSTSLAPTSLSTIPSTHDMWNLASTFICSIRRLSFFFLQNLMLSRYRFQWYCSPSNNKVLFETPAAFPSLAESQAPSYSATINFYLTFTFKVDKIKTTNRIHSTIFQRFLNLKNSVRIPWIRNFGIYSDIYFFRQTKTCIRPYVIRKYVRHANICPFSTWIERNTFCSIEEFRSNNSDLSLSLTYRYFHDLFYSFHWRNYTFCSFVILDIIKNSLNLLNHKVSQFTELSNKE